MPYRGKDCLAYRLGEDELTLETLAWKPDVVLRKDASVLQWIYLVQSSEVHCSCVIAEVLNVHIQEYPLKEPVV